MKKLTSILLALIMLLSCVNAEEMLDFGEMADPVATAREPLPEVLNVVNNTKVTGAFFTDLWSYNTSDIDVRAMLHGLSTVAWVDDLTYDFDPVVVAGHSYQDNEDGSRTYIVTINQGLKYSDGTDITASDYVFSILLQAGPELKELGAAEAAYTYVKGYEAYHSGASNSFEGIRLFGDYTFGITVEAEYLPFFYENSYANVTPYPIRTIAPNCFVVDSGNGAYIRCEVTSITNIDADGNATVEDYSYGTALLAEKLIGENGYITKPAVVSGPYTLVSFDSETGRVEFKINPFYPRQEYSKLYEKELTSIENVVLNTALAVDSVQGMKDGTYQLYNKAVSAATIAEGIEAGFGYTPYGRRGMGCIVYACEGVLENVDLRRAVSSMCDKQSFVEDYLANFGQVVHGYYGIGQWMTQAAMGIINPKNFTPEEMEQWNSVVLDEIELYGYDLARADELLSGAGYTAQNPLELKLAIPEGSGAGRQIADGLIDVCTNLPVSIAVTEVEFTAMISEMMSENREYDMYFIANNFEAVFDPSFVFSTEDDMQGNVNFSRIQDEELFDLALEMRETKPGDVLTYYLRWYEFEKRVADILPILPVYSDVYVDFNCDTLMNYDITTGQGWPQAILFAEFGYPDEVIEEELFVE